MRYLEHGADAPDFFEVTAPSSRHRGPASYAELRRRGRAAPDGFERRTIHDLVGTARVLVHSTNVNPAYADPPSTSELDELKQLLELSGAPWVTEDLGVWLMSERHVYPHFMPLPLTAESLTVCIDNVMRIQGILERPFNAEFPPMTYVVGDMNAFEFFSRLCEATGCGMCVDVGHVLSYQLARGCSPTADFHKLPWEHVTEIHFAGGAIDLTGEGFFYQDDHGDREVVSVCFDLIDQVVESAPNLKAMALELFGARQPAAALRRLRFTRERKTVAAWLAGSEPAGEVLSVEHSRRHVKALSVAMYDLLHSDEPLSGQRLTEHGPEFLDAFATAERRRWDYDRRSRLMILGGSVTSYFPVSTGWLLRESGLSQEALFGLLIPSLDTGRPLDPDSVGDALHTVLAGLPRERLLHELLRCEIWMNRCPEDGPADREATFSMDLERAARGLDDPDAVLASFEQDVRLVGLGDGRFARRGTAPERPASPAPGTLPDPELPVCGTARCCSGD
ncbi:multinuclear nonheme iron-dependent oxidase [Streptomyces bambusae]|uniref:multinuclear nonheme iron-dependent oxidase n=1 Tax=Streptomyces bambusae TaxID=1550616 RepID=UPI0027E13555|nr:DUF692 family multinuclear iron-containing protein [Streptomyces bambusae]